MIESLLESLSTPTPNLNILTEFTQKYSNAAVLVSSNVVSTQDKEQLIELLLKRLEMHLAEKEKQDLTSELLFQELFVLKILSREKIALEGLLNGEAFATVVNCAKFSRKHVQKEALSLLGNMLIQDATLVHQVSDVQVEHIVGILEYSTQDEQTNMEIFPLLRVLFLLTATLAQHSKTLAKRVKTLQVLGDLLVKCSSSTDNDNNMVVSETLKIVFNLMHHCPEGASEYTHLLNPISQIVITSDNIKLEGRLLHAINALVNFHDIQLPQHSQSMTLTDKLLRVLEATIDDAHTNPGLLSVLIVLSNLCKPLSNQECKEMVRSKIMPENVDRSKPLDQGTELPHKLTKLLRDASSNLSLDNYKHVIGNLILVLCDGDVDKAVSYFGYGPLAGYLLAHNLSPSFHHSEHNGEQAELGTNPITGQQQQQQQQQQAELDREYWNSLSDEQKEAEAERLFVLFEKLNKTGVVKVEVQRSSR